MHLISSPGVHCFHSLCILHLLDASKQLPFKTPLIRRKNQDFLWGDGDLSYLKFNISEEMLEIFEDVPQFTGG